MIEQLNNMLSKYGKLHHAKLQNKPILKVLMKKVLKNVES